MHIKRYLIFGILHVAISSAIPHVQKSHLSAGESEAKSYRNNDCSINAAVPDEPNALIIADGAGSDSPNVITNVLRNEPNPDLPHKNDLTSRAPLNDQDTPITSEEGGSDSTITTNDELTPDLSNKDDLISAAPPDHQTAPIASNDAGSDGAANANGRSCPAPSRKRDNTDSSILGERLVALNYRIKRARLLNFILASAGAACYPGHDGTWQDQVKGWIKPILLPMPGQLNCPKGTKPYCCEFGIDGSGMAFWCVDCTFSFSLSVSTLTSTIRVDLVPFKPLFGD